MAIIPGCFSDLLDICYKNDGFLKIKAGVAITNRPNLFIIHAF